MKIVVVPMAVAIAVGLCACDRGSRDTSGPAPAVPVPASQPAALPAPAPAAVPAAVPAAAPAVAPAPAPAPAPKSMEAFSRTYADIQCALAREPDASRHDDLRFQILQKAGYDLKAFVEDKARYGTGLGDQLKASCLPAAALDPSTKVKYLDLAVKVGCAEKTVADTFRLQGERDRLFKEYQVTPEDYGRFVERLKMEDKDFAERLRQGLAACRGDAPPPPAPPTQLPPPGAVEPPRRPAADGLYRAAYRFERQGGTVTFTLRDGRASGSVTLGGRTVPLAGSFHPPKRFGLSGRAGQDSARIEGNVREDGRGATGTLEGTIGGRRVVSSFDASKR